MKFDVNKTVNIHANTNLMFIWAYWWEYAVDEYVYHFFQNVPSQFHDQQIESDILNPQ